MQITYLNFNMLTEKKMITLFLMIIIVVRSYVNIRYHRQKIKLSFFFVFAQWNLDMLCTWISRIRVSNLFLKWCIMHWWKHKSLYFFACFCENIVLVQDALGNLDSCIRQIIRNTFISNGWLYKMSIKHAQRHTSLFNAKSTTLLNHVD